MDTNKRLSNDEGIKTRIMGDERCSTEKRIFLPACLPSCLPNCLPAWISRKITHFSTITRNRTTVKVDYRHRERRINPGAKYAEERNKDLADKVIGSNLVYTQDADLHQYMYMWLQNAWKRNRKWYVRTTSRGRIARGRANLRGQILFKLKPYIGILKLVRQHNPSIVFCGLKVNKENFGEKRRKK